MTNEQFLTHCMAHGGNLSAMLMSGIKKVFPTTYETLPDISYEFGELSWIVDCLIGTTERDNNNLKISRKAEMR